VEQVAVGSWDGQTPSDHHSATNLLNALNLPAPTRSTVVKVAGNVTDYIPLKSRNQEIKS